MVLQGVDEKGGAVPAPPESMPTSPKRSKRLHNFTLPCLKWGSQRYLRCSNAGSGRALSSEDRPSPASWSDISSASRKRESEESETNQAIVSRVRKLEINGGCGDRVGDGIGAMREELILDLKTKANKMKDAFFRNEEDDANMEEKEGKERGSTPSVTAELVEGMRTWNLRTRKAESKSPFAGGVGSGSEKGQKIDEKKRIWSSPARTDGGAAQLPKLRSSSDKTTPRQKFSLQLSKKEIDEDFMTMTGHRPPRKPNKRPKAVQKQLDALFPGSWLTEVTADMYKVAEEPVNCKARHSGKGKGLMHFAESDEESS